MKTFSFSELSALRLSVEVTEITAQTWTKNAKWTGYATVPRQADGFCLFVSPIEAIYDFSDGLTVNAKQGDVVFVPEGSNYTVRFFGGGSSPDLYTVNFRLYDERGEKISLGQTAVFHGAVGATALDSASELVTAFLFDKPALKKQALFLRLLDALVSRFSGNDYYAIRKGVKLLSAEWWKNEKINRYAKACGMSESNFYARFKAWSGKSPVEYRNAVRVTAAKSLLESSNLSVAEIAYKTGFEDAYYFSRLFKKTVGVSPLTYRKNGSL